jgi:septum formation protein
MQLAGIPCEILVSNIDETASGEPEEQVKELALRKAKATLAMLADSSGQPIIIAADTLVSIDGKVLGKPKNHEEAFDMLKSLSGRQHTVYTGVAFLHGEYEHVFADAAYVFFRELSDREIHAYIAAGEPFDKAGAYGVQDISGYCDATYLGDYENVIGLPLRLTKELIERALSF